MFSVPSSSDESSVKFARVLEQVKPLTESRDRIFSALLIEFYQ